MRRLLEFVAFSAAACAVMLFGTPLILAVLTAIYGDVGHVPPSVLGNLIYLSPVFPLLLGIVAIARLKAAGVSIVRLIGISRSTLRGDLILGGAIGLIGLLLALASLSLFSSVAAVPPFHLIPIRTHVYLATIGAVVPGVCEELFYRGMLLHIARPASRWLGVTATAAAFSLWHIGSPIYLPHTFLLGLILGGAVVVRGRLAPAIIGHSLANAAFGAWIISGGPIPGAG
ncbi:MAG: Type prenyl endopeptidase Rce1-like [Sphingomonadales bacterium]|jgi:membrane protease YdiL (CAAX protease family)|nr:Type prenyl endopeptidase Rce1-like [Sphingomonadales bacterium]MEA3048938.1 Type prenyl endopeptidase Rce1-like [Sphingomonadales bacterium]